MRQRKAYVFFGILGTILLWLITDPDLGLISELPFGAGFIATIVLMSKGIMCALLLHITRKAIFDHGVTDFEKLGRKAVETPEGAGLFAIALAIMTMAFATAITGSFRI